MTDRVYPSSKPTTKTTTTTRLPPPPNKTHFQTTTNNRHPHRPNPTTNRHQQQRPQRRRRSIFCLLCFWLSLIIFIVLLITTILGCILYLFYHPHKPTFSINSLKITQFNLVPTSSDDVTTTKLTSKLNLTISTKNPNNKKITFYYNPWTITCLSLDNMVVANGTFRNAFLSKPDNNTIMHTTLYGSSLLMDDKQEAVNKIRSDLKRKSGMPLKIVLDSEIRVKIENIRSKRVGIRIKCEGIHSLVPKGKNTTSKSVAANVSGAKCKMDLRIKIWKWTF